MIMLKFILLKFSKLENRGLLSKNPQKQWLLYSCEGFILYNSRWTVQRKQSMTWCSNMTKSTSSHYKKQLFHPHTTKQLASNKNNSNDVIHSVVSNSTKTEASRPASTPETPSIPEQCKSNQFFILKTIS